MREHVDPGYAAPLHRAQGITVDTSHLLATPGIGRRGMYVAMTRGSDTNLATDHTDPCDHTDTLPTATVRRQLEAILADDRTELSALETHATTSAGATPTRSPTAPLPAHPRQQNLQGTHGTQLWLQRTDPPGPTTSGASRDDTRPLEHAQHCTSPSRATNLVGTLNPTEAQEQLAELSVWVDWLVDRYRLDRRTVPTCWREHGDLVEELSALRTA